MNCNDTMLCSFVNCEEKEIEIILNNDEKVKGKLIHRKSILLLRHGARAPSLQAYKVLLNSDVENLWKKENGEKYLEELTSFGVEQTITIGNFIRELLASNYNYSFSLENIKWESSVIERVQNSGKNFWSGFFSFHDTKEEILSLIDVQIKDKNEREQTFRPWVANKEYNEWLGTIKDSEKVVEFSKNHYHSFVDIYQSVKLYNEEKKNLPSQFLLVSMTYAKELVDCEKYYQFQLARSSSSLPFFPFVSQLNDHQMEKVDELARWCWNERFFKHPFVPQLASNLISLIKIEVEKANTIEDTAVFVLCTAHDYTILCLMAGLQVPSYSQILCFCAYVLIDVFDLVIDDNDQNIENNSAGNGRVERVFTISLNSAPFEDENEKVHDAVQTHKISQLLNPRNQSPYWTLSDLSFSK